MDQLKALNELSNVENAKGTAELIQYIVIRLGEEQFGIDIRYIDNIVRMQTITRVPKVAAYLKGVINLRGEVIPVMSIRMKMGLEEDEITKATRIIILKSESQGNFGIIVDGVKEVVTLDTEQIDKVAYDMKEGSINFLTGVGKHNGELISILDLNAITLEDNA